LFDSLKRLAAVAAAVCGLLFSVPAAHASVNVVQLADPPPGSVRPNLPDDGGALFYWTYDSPYDCSPCGDEPINSGAQAGGAAYLQLGTVGYAYATLGGTVYVDASGDENSCHAFTCHYDLYFYRPDTRKYCWAHGHAVGEMYLNPTLHESYITVYSDISYPYIDCGSSGTGIPY